MEPVTNAVPYTCAVSRKAIGSLGESDAISWLDSRGYRIVDANVRPIGGRSRGEIDIVAWHGEFLVFVEVKTRRASRSASSAEPVPAEAVDLRKRRRLVILAEAYVLKYGLEGVTCRFDVVEVIRRGDLAEFNIIENAFDGIDV